jgi:glucose/arabinose dehydrogenase
MWPSIRGAVVAAAACLVLASAAAAAPQLVKVDDFQQPVHVASPPQDPRLFVVERPGRVIVVDGGVKQTFLDVTDITVSSYEEQGLLSIAFPRDYAAAGLFYVFLTAAGGGDLTVQEYRRSANDPNRADPASRREVLRVPHRDAVNHDGGQLAFGPDGLLYVGTGDGGSAFDPGNDALRLDSLLGKILRIDPRPSGGQPHTIPADNPFAGSAIWALGLRNPWRFSFDRQTGDLAIGDVGQDQREELDFAAAPAAGRGVSYGWRCYEGVAEPDTCTDAERAALQPRPAGPVHELTHADGYVSVIGGFVVRDPGLPTLVGRYLYGDIAKPALRSIALPAGGDREEPGLRVSRLSSFGEDACGRILAASLDGPVYRVQDGSPTPCAFPSPSGRPSGPPANAGCRPSVRTGRAQRVLRRRGVRLRVRTIEACTVTIAGRIRGVTRFRSGTHRLPADATRVVRVRLSPRGLRRVRRTLRHRRSLVARLEITARDGAGRRTRAVKRVRLR